MQQHYQQQKVRNKIHWVTKEQFSKKLEASLFKKYRLNNGGGGEDNNNDNNGDGDGNYRSTKESSFLPSFFLLIQFSMLL
jgi:hypothetical protein